jgi:hypothetical protein
MENDPVDLWKQNKAGMFVKIDLGQPPLAQCSKMQPRGWTRPDARQPALGAVDESFRGDDRAERAFL